jgi:rhodanese-related sulfurtransferase
MPVRTSEVGALPARDAFALLKADAEATLVDVRSAAEWSFVGVPDLGLLGKKVVFAEWQAFPSMRVDPDFGEQLDKALSGASVLRTAPLLFICRSGARSHSAAQVMASRGYSRCINVAGGFEGPCGPNMHRGTIDGWKAAALPWTQS